MGSFTTALIPRVLQGRSWTWEQKQETNDKMCGAARSACTKCSHVLGVFDLIPLLSWLFLRGRCRYCGHPISVFYPLVELSFIALALAVYFFIGFSVLGGAVLCVAPFIVAQGWVYMAYRMWSPVLSGIIVFLLIIMSFLYIIT